ncbi:MAG: type II toxin-antitoxin system HicA family toxin [Chloroflexota bacterium]
MAQRLGPIKRTEFVARLRLLGFEGPVHGGRHERMVYQQRVLAIPSYQEYGPGLHREMLREVGEVLGRTVTREEWAGLQ